MEYCQPAGALSLTGHNGAVTCIAFSPDWKLLVTGAQDETVNLWDVAGGTKLDTQLSGGRFVSQVQFSSDGKLVASTAYEQMGMLWEVAHGTELRPVKTFTGLWLQFSPAGDKVAILNFGEVILWDIYISHKLATFNIYTSPTPGMAFSPTGDLLAITASGWVILWDINHNQRLATIEVAAGVTPGAVFSPDENTVAISYDTSIKLWDIVHQKEIRILSENELSNAQLAFSPDGMDVASFTSKAIKIWNIANEQELNTLRGGAETNSPGLGILYEEFKDRATHLTLSPDGNKLAVAYEGNNFEKYVRLYNLMTWELQGELTGQTGPLAFSPDSKLLATGPDHLRTQEVRIWDLKTLVPILTIHGFTNILRDMAFSPDGTLLATAEGDGYGVIGSAKVWDLRSGKLLAEFGQKHGRETDPVVYMTIWDVTFSPDGKTLMTANSNGVVQFWDMIKQLDYRTMKVSDGQVFALDISPDGKLLATSSVKETYGARVPNLGLWDLSTGELLHELPGYKDNVFKVAFSTNGQVLATTSWDGLILCDLEAGQELVNLEGSYYDSDIAFTPDGTLLVIGGEEVVQLWGIPSP